MRIFLLGYPGHMGGANTEAWHTIKLWRANGCDVHLIPTWQASPEWQAKLDAIGCTTHQTTERDFPSVPGLAGSIVVGMCNHHFCDQYLRLRELGCKLVWVNCMTFLFGHERLAFESHGPPDAMVYQSEFQRSELEPLLADFGYEQAQGHLIRGAFDVDNWTFAPRPHQPGSEYFVGRIARPDTAKWSSNTWAIYGRINYARRRAIMLGVNDAIHDKMGSPPWWADCLAPQSIEASEFYSRLHCLLPVNGGARENWPRAGLEAMASGVPIVTQREWGWREQIIHGETGFLGDNDEEIAHWASVLAYDEALRLQVARNAYDRLVDELANPDALWEGWEQLFHSVSEGVAA